MAAGWTFQVRPRVVVLGGEQLRSAGGAAQRLRRGVAGFPGHRLGGRGQVDGDRLALGAAEGGSAVLMA